MPATKIPWEGEVLGVTPRIRLQRSFDQRSHAYLGYALRLAGTLGGEAREFSIGIGPAAQEKHAFRAGDRVRGLAEPVADPRTEPVEFYKASGLALLARGEAGEHEGPPWKGAPVALPVYRERGHRRLDARTWEARCRDCVWASRMPVEMTIDPWNPSEREYRFETFCYGPKSCALYLPGPRREVPGRNDTSWEEPDAVDEEETAHRGAEE